MLTTDFQVSIVAGRRSFSEVVSSDDLREYWEELVEDNGGQPPLESRSFDYWTRELKDLKEKDLLATSGNHFLFGHIESLFQSDFSPQFVLEEFNNDDEWEYCYSVRHVPKYGS